MKNSVALSGGTNIKMETKEKSVSFYIVVPALMLIIGLALFLRLHKISESFWIDEILTYQRASLPLKECLFIDSAPLAYILTHFTLLLGSDEILLRLPSLLAGLAAVWAMYAIGKSIGGRSTGFIASLLLATAAFHVLISQEARYYSLLSLAGILMIWLLYNSITNNKPLSWISYTLVSFFGFLTHLFFIPFFGAAFFGALVWIFCTRKVPTAKTKCVRVIILVLCAMISMSGIIASLSVQGKSPLSFLGGKSLETTVDPGEITKSEDVKISYRLDGRQYSYFLKELFSTSVPGRIILLLFGLWGLYALWRKDAALALICSSVFILLPIGLMSISVKHWFSTRYFIIQLPVGMIFISYGITNLSTTIADIVFHKKDASDENQEKRGLKHASVSAIAAILFLAILTLPVSEGLVGHYRSLPRNDWARMSKHMAGTITRDDIVVYYAKPTSGKGGADYWRAVLSTPLEFYLERQLKQRDSIIQFMTQMPGNKAADVAEIARKNPFRNIWIITRNEDSQYGKAFSEEMNSIVPGPKRFGNLTLRVLGKPTENLIPMGGFEGDNLPGGYDYVSYPGAYEGTHSLKMTNAIPLKPETRLDYYVDGTSYPIRNSGFELWKDGQPVGWSTQSHSAAFIASSSTVKSGKFSLVLKKGKQTVVLAHSPEISPSPGNVVMLKASAKADNPNQLGIGMRYLIDGELRQDIEYHSGNGQWENISLKANIPPEADPESIEVIILRDGDQDGQVFVDDVSLKAIYGNHRLDPAQQYIFSAFIKHINDPEGPDKQLVSTILIAWTVPDGRMAQKPVYRILGNSDWRQIAFSITPGRDIPVDAKNPIISINPAGGAGTLWIDCVQLELGPVPTPFVQGKRLAHDES